MLHRWIAGWEALRGLGSCTNAEIDHEIAQLRLDVENTEKVV